GVPRAGDVQVRLAGGRHRSPSERKLFPRRRTVRPDQRESPMQRYAITFEIKPGSEEAVRRLLAGYEPPEWVTADGTRLLSTSIFMKGTTVVRVMEIDGSLQ